MKRHIGIWNKEFEPDKKEVGELLIEGNHVEFYSRFPHSVFPETFIGEDGQYTYKVFVNGYSSPGQSQSIEYAASHRVFYVLMQNFEFSKGTDISGIKEFSFIIPELLGWIGINTVFYTMTDENELAAGECHFEEICIREENPKVHLYFESRTSDSITTLEDSSTITIKKIPRIRVTYDEPADIQYVCTDIECLMQFFGLLIGKVSVAEDIRLSIDGQKSNSWLYINRDFSYNLMTQDTFDKPRTYHYVVADKLSSYYLNWCEFFGDEQYALLRRIFFSVNGRKPIFAEEIFVEYMRILDGYHTRAYGDAETEVKLKEALKEAKKLIKKQIFIDDNRPIFEEAFQKVIPDWKYNSSNMDNISGWIASGYLSRKSLSHRLKELDEDYFGIIKNNAIEIEKLPKVIHKTEGMNDEQVMELYFKELGDTRNYYSHYKQDRTGVLDFSQMGESINTLKASIIAIFLSRMGIEQDLLRRILEFDNELNFQTMFLRREGDEPFLHPKDWMKKYNDSETSSEGVLAEENIDNN